MIALVSGRVLARVVSVGALCLLLAACGGGGGGGGGGASTSSGSPSGSSSGSGSPSVAQISVNTTGAGAPIVADQIGANLAVWYDFTQAGSAAAVQSLGVKLVRWPGGSDSDVYHWQTNTGCAGAFVAANTSFDNFVADIVKPGGYDLAITLNYGSNAACTGGGDPTEAAAWVAHAKTLGLTGLHWTVGNEVYGSWEYDLHAVPHDPTTYANATAGANGYYALVKAQDPTAKVGVVVAGDGAAWDTTVLANAPYDFVELHYYAQNPGSENDTTLLTQSPAQLTALIKTVQSELAAAGKPNTPIYLGEFNSVSSNPGKQSVSIVNGLYAGMALGEVLNDGIPMATWWQAIGAGCSTGGNNSSTLYGWQSFGSYGLTADNWPNPYGCVGAPSIPLGTPMPSGQAMTLASQFAIPGGQMLPVTVPTSLPNVRAYAAKQGAGYALMLFNLDQANSVTFTAQMANATATQFTVNTITYGKAQYDASQTNVWTGPVSASLGVTTTSPTLTLPPWSMVVVQLK